MVFETVCRIIAERIECDPESITRESTFRDLGIDSLDTVDLMMNLDGELGLELELDEKLETVGDLVDFIESKQE